MSSAGPTQIQCSFFIGAWAGWGWTPNTQISTNEKLMGFAISAALLCGHWAASCSFHHQNHCVLPSWSISPHGENRPVGSQSCSFTPGTVYCSFALWQNSGHSWKCHCMRCGGFASTNAVVSGCLFSFWEKVWCRREGTSWKMANDGRIMASLGVSGLSVSFGKSKTNSCAEFALVISSPPDYQPRKHLLLKMTAEQGGKNKNLRLPSQAFASPKAWPLSSCMLQTMSFFFSPTYNSVLTSSNNTVNMSKHPQLL